MTQPGPRAGAAGVAPWRIILAAALAAGCAGSEAPVPEEVSGAAGPAPATQAPPARAPYVVVLGVAQDGGYPQAGTPPGDAWAPERRRYAASLGLVDPVSGQRWLFEATPDFRDQLQRLDGVAPAPSRPGLDGIFLTHAHVGHYTGLMQVGHEVIGASAVPVYAMPRMGAFLTSDGPWSQLVDFGNIELRPLADATPVRLNDRLTVTPFLVPHRDEFSETVGFLIQGPQRAVLFLPDIDKWERWDERGGSIEGWVARGDVAYLDGTFYADGEIPNRAMADIPHPFITETMTRFADAPPATRARIRFIHLNRTNPALFEGAERAAIEAAGFGIAAPLEVVGL